MIWWLFLTGLAIAGGGVAAFPGAIQARSRSGVAAAAVWVATGAAAAWMAAFHPYGWSPWPI